MSRDDLQTQLEIADWQISEYDDENRQLKAENAVLAAALDEAENDAD